MGATASASTSTVTFASPLLPSTGAMLRDFCDSVYYYPRCNVNTTVSQHRHGLQTDRDIDRDREEHQQVGRQLQACKYPFPDTTPMKLSDICQPEEIVNNQINEVEHNSMTGRNIQRPATTIPCTSASTSTGPPLSIRIMPV